MYLTIDRQAHVFQFIHTHTHIHTKQRERESGKNIDELKQNDNGHRVIMHMPHIINDNDEVDVTTIKLI